MLSCHSSTFTSIISISDWLAVGEFGISLSNRRKFRDTDISQLKDFNGTSERFVRLQQGWFPEYYETALEERFRVAVGVAKKNEHQPFLFRLALSRNCIPKLAVHMRDRDGQTLVHVVAWVMGRITGRPTWYNGSKKNALLEGMSHHSTTVTPKYL